MKNDNVIVFDIVEILRIVNAAKEPEQKQTKIYCNICKKSFASKNAFVQHESSKKHLKMAKEAANTPKEDKPIESPAEVEKEDKSSDDEFTPEEYEFNAHRCMFCGFISESTDEYSFILLSQ